jgi:hypothetical protein
VAAIEAADRVLAAGPDPGARAAGVAAAAGAADGALVDAAGRWRGIAAALGTEPTRRRPRRPGPRPGPRCWPRWPAGSRTPRPTSPPPATGCPGPPPGA